MNYARMEALIIKYKGVTMMGFQNYQFQKTILFDLDGTLLPMDMRNFEKKYFMELSNKLKNRIHPKELYKVIWDGTKQMILNDGSKTNQEAFRHYLNEHTILNYDECEDEFMDFYKNDFQKCVTACNLTDLSKKIIEELQNKGYQVAIATNPIFPQIATYSRLKWLNIEPERFPLVTTFENSHYAKPNPKYYEEVCHKLKVKPENCIMVGNDVKEDGVAAKIGIEVKLIEDCLLNADQLSIESFEKGSLLQFYTWCRNLPANH